MTTTDKTEEKLVASIRRTKTGVTTADTPATGMKPASPRRRASVPPRVETAAAAPEAPKAGDGYQSAGRVWPD